MSPHEDTFLLACVCHAGILGKAAARIRSRASWTLCWSAFLWKWCRMMTPQIALAMHNYHDAYNGLPAQAIYSKDGKPLLSWRVAILPFIEEDNLYRQFKLNELWD